MKVIILGACGGMGRYVAKSISSFKEIDNLGIADLNKVDLFYVLKNINVKMISLRMEFHQLPVLVENYSN